MIQYCLIDLPVTVVVLSYYPVVAVKQFEAAAKHTCLKGKGKGEREREEKDLKLSKVNCSSMVISIAYLQIQRQISRDVII